MNNNTMRNSLKAVLIIAILICWNSFQTMAQLSFHIDSLSFKFYGDKPYDSSWENKVLYHFGPDVVIYGKLINNSDTPVILDLIKSPGTPDDSLTIYRTLRLYVSYHYRKDYCFTQCPLDIADIMSYPYLNGVGLPIEMEDLDGREYSYAIIGAGETMPLAFETLSKPIINVSEIRSFVFSDSINYRKTIMAQRRAAKAIKSSIVVTPVVENLIDSPDIFNQLLDRVSSLKKNPLSNNYEDSIPLSFLDIKPYFINGGVDGFCKWLKYRMEDVQYWPSGEEHKFRILFIVRKDGCVVLSRIYNIIQKEALSGEIEKALKGIFIQSPPWFAGMLHGEVVDSRVNLLLSIDADGRVKNLSIIE